MKKCSDIAYWVFAAGTAGSIAFSVYIFLNQPNSENHLTSPMMGPLSLLQFYLLFMGFTLLFGLFVAMPFLRRWRAEQIELSSRAAELEVEVVTDPLTKLYNRRYFEDALEQYLKEFDTTDAPLALLTLDLDHFKNVNDTHGHSAGDIVLRRLADKLKSLTREYDIVARTGGEEFCIVAPFPDTDQIKPFAERICETIGRLKVEIGSITLHPTVSIGVASTADGVSSAQSLMELSDKRLYTAKRLGRNRVCA